MLSALLSQNWDLNAGIEALEAQSPEEHAFAPHPAPTGELVQDPDFYLPTTAGSLPFRLFYFSNRSLRDVGFGFGRRASWPLRLCSGRRASWPLRLCSETSGGVTTVLLERENGYGAVYSNASGSYQPVTQRIFDSLVKNGDGSWDETRLDTGTVFHSPAGTFASFAYY